MAYLAIVWLYYWESWIRTTYHTTLCLPVHDPRREYRGRSPARYQRKRAAAPSSLQEKVRSSTHRDHALWFSFSLLFFTIDPFPYCWRCPFPSHSLLNTTGKKKVPKHVDAKVKARQAALNMSGGVKVSPSFCPKPEHIQMSPHDDVLRKVTSIRKVFAFPIFHAFNCFAGLFCTIDGTMLPPPFSRRGVRTMVARLQSSRWTKETRYRNIQKKTKKTRLLTFALTHHVQIRRALVLTSSSSVHI